MSEPNRTPESQSLEQAGAPSSTSLTEIPVDAYRLTVEQSERGSLIRLINADGNEPLRIELGPRGPVLYVGSNLAIAVAGQLQLAAERVDIHVREGLALRSEGEISLHCEGDLVSVAREHDIRARLGDVRLEANDDVKLLGERVRLNC